MYLPFSAGALKVVPQYPPEGIETCVGGYPKRHPGKHFVEELYFIHLFTGKKNTRSIKFTCKFLAVPFSLFYGKLKKKDESLE